MIKTMTYRSKPDASGCVWRTFDLNVIDEDTRTFQVSASSDLPVDMGHFVEILSHDPEDVDMSFLSSGNAPMLDTHDSGVGKSVTGNPGMQIGVVQSAKLEGGRSVCVLRLSSGAEFDRLWGDIKDRIVKNVSIGYKRLGVEEVGETEDGRPVVRTKWRPHEISLVPIPADESVGVGRAIENVEIIMNREEIEKIARRYGLTQDWVEKHVRAKSTTAQAQADAEGQSSDDEEGDDGDDPPSNPEGERSGDQGVDPEAIRAAERSRIAAIQGVATRHSLPADWAQGQIESGASESEARLSALDEIATRTPPASTTILTGGNGNNSVGYRQAVTAAILTRNGIALPEELRSVDVNEYRAMSLMQMASDHLNRAGVSTRSLHHEDIAARAMAHTTSDFMVALQNALNITLVAGFETVENTWQNFASVSSVENFKKHKRIRGGAFSDLMPVNESGEFEGGEIDDADSFSVSAGTKGRIVALTRETIINDDIGYLLSALDQMGQAAGRTLEKDCYAFLASNPLLEDGHRLFSLEHGNLITGEPVPTQDNIDSGIQLMGSQTNKHGDIYAIRPELWMGALNLETTAHQINRSTTDVTQANPGVAPKVSGTFKKIAGTARIANNTWYMFANQNQVPVIQVAFLRGRTTPILLQHAPFTMAGGIQYLVVYDYGVNAVGHEGAVKFTN